MNNYDHNSIEKKWQKFWDENATYRTMTAAEAKSAGRDPYYVLDMFPYPSGAGLHVGHPRGYIASDVFARMKRMQGFNVLHPMGFDSFGLPAEQYAIQTGNAPGPFTNELVAHYREQLSILGFSYDWDRQVATHDPKYYKWTQWIFLKIYESWYDKNLNKARPVADLEKIFVESGNGNVNAACDQNVAIFSADEWSNFSDLEKQNVLMKYRLAYEGFAEVNWCAELGTVLANDEIVEKDGKMVSERGEFPVVKKQMRQWFMRITAYADRLLAGLNEIDWSDSIKEIQRNWIGRSEGSEIDFKLVRTNPSPTLPEGKGAAPRYVTSNAQSYAKLHERAVEMRESPTEAEEKIWNELKGDKTGFHFRRQHIIGEFIPDFVCLEKKLIVEIDGEVHDHLQERDSERTHILESQGFRVIRFSNNRVLEDTHSVIDEIKNELVREVLPLGEDLGGVSVFITRADTLFGVTYVVLAPEHQLVQNLKSQIENWSEVENYISEVKSKSDEDRIAAKEKTGVEIKGVMAINPANGECVPVWVADYVLANYGTGAVMAVPAHDERDFEFAKKYGLPMREVISDLWVLKGEDAEQKNAETINRKVVDAIIKDKEENFYLINENKKIHFVGGGIDEGESELVALRREIIEETGFTDFEITRKTNPYLTIRVFRHGKNKNQRSIGCAYEVVLNSFKKINSEIEQGKHELVKFKKDEVLRNISWEHHKYLFENYLTGDSAFTNYGVLFNSENFNDLPSQEAKKKITEFVGGKLVTKYRMRDAIFARQRYWGEPIPLVHDANGLIREIPESKLPLELPEVASYAPIGTGESPLAGVPSWVESGYETNTMPGWAGSSWYFLRYTDPKNDSEFASPEELNYWFSKNGGVQMYVGGAEHATGHLLYSRFWHKALKDLGYVQSEEPFAALRNQGLIGGADGRKMSKRWGNVINPDDVVRDLGADTLRVYEAFMGPFNASLPWSVDGIVGSRRFVEKIWRLAAKASVDVKTPIELEKALHKAIKKVSEDISDFAFNTAVSAMMIFGNVLEKADEISSDDFKKFLKILAPFAPHISEELWSMLGETESIHLSPWPSYDANLIVDDTVKIGIQINGKVRADIELAKDESEESVREKVFAMDDVKKWLEGKEIRKFIYVPGKIISIVI